MVEVVNPSQNVKTSVIDRIFPEFVSKPRGTSPVKQIVDAANTRCELACIERDDSREPLAFTVFENRAGDISKRYELGPDGKIKPAKSKAALYDARAYRAESQDLEGLSELLDMLPPNAALSNGLFDETDVRVTTLGHAKAGGEKVPRSRAHMRWRAEAGVVAFDVDIQAGREEVDGLPITPRTMDALLCECVGWWGSVDRLYRYSPSSGIADLAGNILKPLKNFRIFIAVDDMTKTEALGAEVHAALHEAGHGWIELAANGNMLDRTLIDPCMYRPEHLIYVNPSLGAGLKRIACESLLIRGKHDRLATAGKGLSCTIAEWRRSSPSYKALVEAKRPEQRAFVERLKEQARAEARAKGEPEELAAVRVGQVADRWLPPEFEVCLEGGEVVTCRKMLEHPDKYDGKRCYEPSDWTYRDEDPRIGLIYLKNGLAQIYSHAHGGTRYFMQPLPLLASAFDEFPPLTAEEEAEVAKLKPTVTMLGKVSEFEWRTSENPDVNILNQRHAVAMLGGQLRVVNITKSGDITYSRKSDFIDRYANRILTFPPAPPETKEIKIPLGVYWWKHRDRRQYDGIEFAVSNPTPRFFNLWRGWACEPSENGQCNLFFDYINEVLASRDAGLCDYLIKYIAHIVQKPHEKPGVALVLRGPRGAGKTHLCKMLSLLMPRNTRVIVSPRALTGHFNAHLQNTLLAQVEEAFWAGDKAAEGALKNMLTNDVLEIEPKGIDPFPVRNYTRFIMSSNEGWVVPAGLNERRFTVIDVGRSRLQDHRYFAAIQDQLENGGLPRLLWELKRVDLTGFNARHHYHTSALDDQVRLSLNPLESFVCEALEKGELPSDDFKPAPWGAESLEVKTGVVFDAYRQFEQDLRKYPTDERVFGKRLRDLLPGVKKHRLNKEGERTHVYVFPPLEECRKEFEVRFGFKLKSEDLDCDPPSDEENLEC